jgi:hypothetical protein
MKRKHKSRITANYIPKGNTDEHKIRTTIVSKTSYLLNGDNTKNKVAIVGNTVKDTMR